MKKVSLFTMIFALSMFLMVSCGGGEKNNDESHDTNDETTEVANDDTNESDTEMNTSNSKMKEFTSDDGSFSINFPGTPTKDESPVQTELGSLDMVTYMYEEGMSAYMVAYSDYPEVATEASDPYDLLEGAKGGYVGNIGLEIKKEEKSELDGKPGIYFEAEGGGYYTVVQDYLDDNRLYQIAILRMDRNPSEKEIEDFIKTFKFLK